MARKPNPLLPFCVVLLLGGGTAFFTAPLWSPLPERILKKAHKFFFNQPEAPVSPTRATPSLPERFYPQARMLTLPLLPQLDLEVTIQTEAGQTVLQERESPDAYHLQTRLTYRVPRAAQTLKELESVQTSLSEHWPSLPAILPTAQVSPYFHSLYQRKVTFLEMRVDHIREIPSRHNMYDCHTILEWSSRDHPTPLLLIQADMDVVTDGSDSDRTTDIDTSSPTFQPFTAYNWAKKTQTPNPLIAHYQSELKELEARLDQPGLSENERYLASRRSRVVRQTLEALRYRSSLVAHLDPFIVLPIFMTKETGVSPESSPAVGDYALVLFQDLILPAIVGDTGPNSKIGEASLKIARAIDPSIEATGASRPVSRPQVTYLVFPGSAEPTMQPPDLEKWEMKCRELFLQVGGDPKSVNSWKESPRQDPEADTPKDDSAGYTK